MTATTSNFYQIGASLPVDAPSYVRRQADEEFYQKLQAGKFCYVLNSRQMGKSSLRVQTMQRLQKEGTICAAIDLTGIGKVSQQQWYGGIVYNLSESCQLEDKFDFDWQEWWGKHQTVLSPVQCLNLFIEKVLLAKIQQPIVIFVDEIDKVLSQDFSADDFFGLIRFFQNQRVDNPIFQRLTFALLGVATPGDLIRNKTQTPFNIGEAIELHGFKFDEVQPLINGLRGRFENPRTVMEEILDWTGGQPFLTQKLCKLILEESEKDNSFSVKEVVKSRVIENWESQDDPEHLRTIRDRILSSEQRAGYLLELYQQIQKQGEVAAKKNIESSELRLSGLVVQREGKLRVYNRVYQKVFNKNWVETQLNNLRPYSENFRFWVGSEGKDESRLLQGNALKEAEKWAIDKNLSFQDKQFLAASREKEIQEKIAVEKREAQLERERKDKEAAEKRNLVLSEANQKAKQRIRNGTIVLGLAVLGAMGLGVFALREGNKAIGAQEKAKDARKEVQLAKEQVKIEKQKAKDAKQQAQTEQRNALKAQKIAKNANKKVKLAKQQVQTEKNNAQAARKQAQIEQQNALKAQKIAKNANKKVKLAKQQVQTEKHNAQAARKQAQIEQQNALKAQKIVKNAKQKTESLQNQLASEKKNFKTVQALSKLVGELLNENLTAASDEALRQASLSFNINDHDLKQAMLLAAMSQGYQNLLKEQKHRNPTYQQKAEENIRESLEYLKNKRNKIRSAQGLQIKVLVKVNQGKLLAKKSKKQAIKAYQEAFYVLKNHYTQTNPFNNDKDQILTTEDIESVHRGLLKLQRNRDQEVWNSLKEHFYDRLENSLRLKNWRTADTTTDRLMLFIANREKEAWLDIPQIEKISCYELKKMDDLWVQNSERYFGFSVQKEIWNNVQKEIWNNNKNYYRFASAVGWYSEEGSDWVSYDHYIDMIKKNRLKWRGLPTVGWATKSEWMELRGGIAFFSRISACKI